MSLPPRPFSTRIVQWGVTLLALWNLARGGVLWQQSDWLADLHLNPDPRWRMALAFLWAATFLLLAAALWRCRGWARRFAPFLLAAYGVYELGLILVYAPSPPAALPALAYAAFVGFAAWALRRPAAQAYFESRTIQHIRHPQNGISKSA
jgi:hypothetical protein